MSDLAATVVPMKRRRRRVRDLPHAMEWVTKAANDGRAVIHVDVAITLAIAYYRAIDVDPPAALLGAFDEPEETR